jgi:hypothetical protein
VHTRCPTIEIAATVVEDAKIGHLQTGKEPALLGKNECRKSYKPDWDSDRGYLLRVNQGSKTEGESRYCGPHGLP